MRVVDRRLERGSKNRKAVSYVCHSIRMRTVCLEVPGVLDTEIESTKNPRADGCLANSTRAIRFGTKTSRSALAG
jgi:hypothetical protein